jgi:putative transposase
MQGYRRNRIPGATYFFTVNLLDRSSALLVDEITNLRASVVTIRQQHPFHIDAWVVLPDHMHCLWTLPEGDSDYPTRWRKIKAAFSHQTPTPASRNKSRSQKHERDVWQRRYWEHTIRDDRDYTAHIDYVHFNPVKHGYVANVAAWPYSTFHRCVAKGLFPANWAAPSDLANAGERANYKAP